MKKIGGGVSLLDYTCVGHILKGVNRFKLNFMMEMGRKVLKQVFLVSIVCVSFSLFGQNNLRDSIKQLEFFDKIDEFYFFKLEFDSLTISNDNIFTNGYILDKNLKSYYIESFQIKNNYDTEFTIYEYKYTVQDGYLEKYMFGFAYSYKDSTYTYIGGKFDNCYLLTFDKDFNYISFFFDGVKVDLDEFQNVKHFVKSEDLVFPVDENLNYTQETKSPKLTYYDTYKVKEMYYIDLFTELKNGSYSRWHVNGELAVKGKWKLIRDEDTATSVKDGHWYFFDEKGALTKKEFYENGVQIENR